MANSSAGWVKFLRWFARISGTFLAFMVIALFVGEAIEKGSLNIPGRQYAIAIPFWLAQVGLLLAWRWEGFGGALALGSIIVAIAANAIMIQHTRSLVAFTFWLIPASMFLVCWYLSTRPEPFETVDPESFT